MWQNAAEYDGYRSQGVDNDIEKGCRDYADFDIRIALVAVVPAPSLACGAGFNRF